MSLLDIFSGYIGTLPYNRTADIQGSRLMQYFYKILAADVKISLGTYAGTVYTEVIQFHLISEKEVGMEIHPLNSNAAMTPLSCMHVF